MSEEKTYTEQEAHRHFAASLRSQRLEDQDLDRARCTAPRFCCFEQVWQQPASFIQLALGD